MQTNLAPPILRTLQAIGYFFYVVWTTIERVLIIHPVEFIMRAWYALDPRVYFTAMRVKAVIDGKLERKDGAFFIFILYAKSSLPDFTRNAIDAIANSSHNLIIVSNAPLPPTLSAELTGKCHKLIERKNIGRDFGGYKDGVDYVLEHYPDASRLVLMNDSVFFFRRSLDKLIARLNGQHDFIGVTEVHQYHYHVQSFMLSFGSAVLRSEAFRRFWRRYRPISTRRWAIFRGELQLTQELTGAGFRPHILFPAVDLLPHFRGKPARKCVQAIRLLPVEARDGLYSLFQSTIDGEYSGSFFPRLEAMSHDIGQILPHLENDDDPFICIKKQVESLDRWSFDFFADQIVSSISRNNQMHHGGFLFMKYLELPILKRDIFYRELYTLEDVYQFLTEMNELLRDEVLADLRRSGSGAHLQGFSRLMYRHGSL